jgi:hypothetical protein
MEAPVEVDRVRYGATSPWPGGASGAGPSIARRNAALWGDTPGNWAAEVPGGSPGRANLGASDSATVAGRHVFYNNSNADGNDPAANARDDAAIAAGKSALRSGDAAGASHTSYARGLNGIMVDLSGLPAGAEASLSPADFDFRVGLSGDPASWALGPVPSITIRRGSGVSGSDRVTLIWPDGAILNRWLRVTVKATANTGLADADAFFFGNLAGDVNGDRAVNGSDFAILAANFGKSGAGMSFATGDLNADGAVNASDFAVLGGNFGKSLPAVQVSPSVVQVRARTVADVSAPPPPAATAPAVVPPPAARPVARRTLPRTPVPGESTVRGNRPNAPRLPRRRIV